MPGKRVPPCTARPQAPDLSHHTDQVITLSQHLVSSTATIQKQNYYRTCFSNDHPKLTLCHMQNPSLVSQTQLCKLTVSGQAGRLRQVNGQPQKREHTRPLVLKAIFLKLRLRLSS